MPIAVRARRSARSSTPSRFIAPPPIPNACTPRSFATTAAAARSPAASPATTRSSLMRRLGEGGDERRAVALDAEVTDPWHTGDVGERRVLEVGKILQAMAGHHDLLVDAG